MKELIKITGRTIGAGEVNSVDAREQHRFLESKQDFSTWIKSRFEQYGFMEGVDFIVFHNSVENSTGRPRIDYFVSIDAAKELSMVERNEKPCRDSAILL